MKIKLNPLLHLFFGKNLVLLQQLMVFMKSQILPIAYSIKGTPWDY